MYFYVLMLFTFSCVSAGSSCPDRALIHPCICMDKQVTRSDFANMVICQRLENGDSLKDIEANLSSIDIDKFLLYDSFWSTNTRNVQINARIPTNYMSTLRITEVILVDTELTAFGCPHEDYCRTTHLKRFTAINSTVTENPNCTSIYSWISCSDTVESIEVRGGYMVNHTLKPDFFPDPLIKLKLLKMPYNHITRIDRRVFLGSKFPVLEVLDLSHNLIRDIRTQFVSELNVKYLDLSYNFIRNVVDFEKFPVLQHLNLSNNHILILLQNNWIDTPSSLKTIDLRKNNLDCNCGNQWINSTFHVSTNLLGHCASPPQLQHMKLRKASRLLNLRCRDDGTIASSNIRPTTPSTTQ